MSFFQRNLIPLLLLACTGMQEVHAVPAWPGIITAIQPDGTAVELRLRGDEYVHWGETPDGYTLLRDDNGWWKFAELHSDGYLFPSALCYSGSSEAARLAGIAPRLAFPQGQLREMHAEARKQMPSTPARIMQNTKNRPQRALDPTLQIDNSFPTEGKHKLLILLVNFADTQTTFSQQDFEEMMNAENYNGYGSFRDYYLNESYGKLDIATTVTRWIRLPYSKSLYGSDGAVQMIADALDAIDDEIDLKDFDNDGDGILDGLAVIHQGPGQEITGAAEDIWSHSSTITGMTYDGVQVRRYTMEPEVLGTTGRISTIGVMCHEFGHNLGAPDFYDTDYSESGGEYCGTGRWDLLGSGAWNGNLGDTPAPINAWQKIQMGWLTPTTLNATCHIDAMQSAGSAPVAYRMDTTVPGEYFILENRQQRDNAFHASVPGSGMIIYHVDEGIIRDNIYWNVLNITHPQGIYMVCGDAVGDADSRVSSYGDINVASALYGTESGHTAFSDYTLPSARSRSGRYSYKSLENIATNTDGTLRFEFTQSTVPPPPTALQAHASRGKVSISWEKPQPSDDDERAMGEPIGYNLYRNGTWIALVEGLEYNDDVTGAGTSLTYQIDAVYASKMVSPYIETSIRIPQNLIATTDAAIFDNGHPEVRLTWTMPTTLSRMESTERYEECEYNGISTIDYAHRFSAADLVTLRGYKIRRVGFLPCSGPQEVTLTLRVWQAEAGGKNPQVVSERTIKEFGNFMWNDILLTNPVKITDQEELWIGIHCESNRGTLSLMHDSSSEGLGLGNWVNINDGGWNADTQCTGNYYLRFTLAVPEAPETASEILVPDHLENPDTDLRYPIGFGVYRDGTFLGFTGNTCFVDASAEAGTHTYEITNLYKGNNESEPLSLNVSVEAVGIDNPLSKKTLDDLVIRTLPAGIIFEGHCGKLHIIDAGGRLIFDGLCNGMPIPLATGFYIVSPEHGNPQKFVVK